MKKGILYLEPLTCPSCLLKIEGAVKGVKGVDKNSVDVLFNSSKVNLLFDENVVDIKTVSKAVEKVGYDVKKTSIK